MATRKKEFLVIEYLKQDIEEAESLWANDSSFKRFN